MPWTAIGQVTSIITLVAFVVAALSEALRRYFRSRERQLLAAPEAERSAVIQALNNAFLIPALPIDPAQLTETQRYEILLAQIRDRARRYYVTVFALLVAAVVLALATLIANRRATNESPTQATAADLQSASRYAQEHPSQCVLGVLGVLDDHSDRSVSTYELAIFADGHLVGSRSLLTELAHGQPLKGPFQNWRFVQFPFTPTPTQRQSRQVDLRFELHGTYEVDWLAISELSLTCASGQPARLLTSGSEAYGPEARKVAILKSSRDLSWLMTLPV